MSKKIYYYEMFPDDSVENISVCIDSETHSFNRFRLRGKGYIHPDEWPKGMTFYMSNGLLPDYIVGGLTYMPISNRLRIAIEECDLDGFQFLPAQVIHPAFPSPQDYWILNVFITAEALNWSETQWVFPDKVKTDKHPLLNIWKPTLNIDAVQGIDMFHMTVKGDLHTSIFLSERVKQSIQNSKATVGLELIPIETM